MSQLLPEVPLVRQASRKLVRELGLLKDPKSHISTTQCHALIELDRGEVLTIAALADLLQLDKSTTSRTMAKLERNGLVTRRENPRDRRQKPLALTDAGRRAIGTIDRTTNQRVHSALGFLSAEERREVLRGIELYVKGLGRAKCMKEIVISPIRRTDNRALAEIIRQNMAEFGLDRPGSGYDEPELDHLYETYQGSDRVFLVAAMNGRLLGGAGVAPLKGDRSGTCELQRMYLSSEARGRGIGASLLKGCLAFAKKAGYGQCYLETMAGMDKAQKLYRAFGFRKLKARAGATGHCACNTWYMKTL